MFKFNNINGLIQEFLFPSYLIKPFWGAVIGAAVTMYQGSKASKAAGAAGAGQGKLTQEQIDFAKGNYEDYKNIYGGLDQQLMDSLDEFAARNTLSRHTGEGITDVRSSYAKAGEMSDRNLTRYGLDPSDPRYAQQKQAEGLSQAKSEIVARNVAREKVREEEDQLFAKRLAVGKYGKQSSDKERMVLGALGEGADLYGRQAAGYGKQAGDAFGAAGEFIGDAADGYSDMMYGGDSSYNDFPGATGSVMNEPVWEGSNYVSDADTGDLGW